MFVDVSGVRFHALSLGGRPAHDARSRRVDRELGGVGGANRAARRRRLALHRRRPPRRRGLGIDLADISVEAMVSDVVSLLDAFGVECRVVAGESHAEGGHRPQLPNRRAGHRTPRGTSSGSVVNSGALEQLLAIFVRRGQGRDVK